MCRLKPFAAADFSPRQRGARSARLINRCARVWRSASSMDAQSDQASAPSPEPAAELLTPGQSVPAYGRERSDDVSSRLPTASVKSRRNSKKMADLFCTRVDQTTATLTPGSDQAHASADEMQSLKDGVSTMALEMLTGEKQVAPAGILMPTQPFVLWWEGLSALLLVYTALVLPCTPGHLRAP